MDEAVGICSEKGKPLLYDLGGLVGTMAGISTGPGHHAWVPAVLSLVKHLANSSAKVGVDMHLANCTPLGTLMARDYMREGYVEAGRADMYSPDRVAYIPDWVTQQFYSIDYAKREKPGAGIVIGGHWWATNVSLIETLNLEDAFVVSGTVYAADNAPGVIASDVSTMGEENVAMGAYLSGDELSASCLVGEDVIKIALYAAGIILAIASLFYGQEELLRIISGWK
jgi:hypothetical protein